MSESLALVAIATAVLGGLFSIYNSRKTHQANAELEEYKQKATRSLEEYKSEVLTMIQEGLQNAKYQLERERLAHEIKFKDVYAKASEVVVKLFEHLTNAYRAGRELLEFFDSVDKAQRTDRLTETFIQLRTFIFYNRIYLPRDVHQAVNRFIGELNGVTDKFLAGYKQHEIGGGGMFWPEALDKFNSDIMKSYEQVCGEMQMFVGLDTVKAKSV
jgi:hypothetical protein